jgi:hypothetical protein
VTIPGSQENNDATETPKHKTTPKPFARFCVSVFLWLKLSHAPNRKTQTRIPGFLVIGIYLGQLDQLDQLE